MKFRVLTLMPQVYGSYFLDGVVARALRDGIIEFCAHDLRDFSERSDRRVDARPFGGGEGMVIRADVTDRALKTLKTSETHTVFVNPAGRVLSSALARQFAQKKELLIVCGRYDGFDRRVIEQHADDEVSIGDFVLSGGDLAAQVIIDTVSRFVPGVLGNEESSAKDSFEGGLLEGPLYTRPSIHNDCEVPAELLSGDHARVARFRRKGQLIFTALKRPDLIQELWGELSTSEQKLVARAWKHGK